MALDDDLVKWMDVLIDYAKDWDQTFPKKEYFTQEFWYELSRIPRRLFRLSQAASAAGSSRLA
jgi:hypothetical protein